MKSKKKIAEHDDEEERNLLTRKSILVANSELAQYFKNHPMLAPKFKRGYWTEIKEMKMNVQNIKSDKHLCGPKAISNIE